MNSFSEIPISEASVHLWKKFLDKRDNSNYTNDEVLTIIKSDPNPVEYEEKKLVIETKKYASENQRSDLVKSIILDNGGDLDSEEDVPGVAEYEIE